MKIVLFILTNHDASVHTARCVWNLEFELPTLTQLYTFNHLNFTALRLVDYLLVENEGE